MLEITGFRAMNEPEEYADEYVTAKYINRLQDNIKPEHFVYALLMAEEYRRDGFTFDGFIDELKNVIVKSLPERNVALSYELDKNLNNIKMYTDIVLDISKNKK